MSKLLWTWGLMGGAVLLLSGYSLLKAMSNGHPLLTADQAAVARWYPLYCFAELYYKAPSLDGQLIPGCIVSVIHEVRAETGVTLTEEDVQSPDVLAHFKTVYGKDQPWRD
ncbi:hypothetical protein DDE05_56925 [Streptomyces cavourensis]|nr:hypothetical protein DDE05_56925 [Streptomyces cavourensis]